MQILPLYITPLIVLAVDFITKKIALATLFTPGFTCIAPTAAPHPPVAVMPFFNFTAVWNPGVSFGFLGGGGDTTRYALTGFALLIGFALPYASRHWGRFGSLGGKLMAAGALGNAIDRMLYDGCVVDFIDIYAGQWHWPAFNIADIGITIGAGLILMTTLSGRRQTQ